MSTSKSSLGIVFSIILVLLIGIVIGYFFGTRAQLVQVQPTATPMASPSDTSQVFQNDYMKVDIPAGWTVLQATETVDYGNCDNKENCTTNLVTQTNPAAINITKDGYILYINAYTTQASGVTGGRFGEIAQGAPSADTVVDIYPDACSRPVKTNTSGQFSRYDYYVSKASAFTDCQNYPADGSSAWYFSYMSVDGGYFNYYADHIHSYVITMAYDGHDISALPHQGSAELNAMLDQMTGIANSLVLFKK